VRNAEALIEEKPLKDMDYSREKHEEHKIPIFNG